MKQQSESSTDGQTNSFGNCQCQLLMCRRSLISQKPSRAARLLIRNSVNSTEIRGLHAVRLTLADWRWVSWAVTQHSRVLNWDNTCGVTASFPRKRLLVTDILRRSVQQFQTTTIRKQLWVGLYPPVSGLSNLFHNEVY